MGALKDQDAADGAIKVAVDECNNTHGDLMQDALGEFHAGRPGEGRPFGAIARELVKAEVAAVDTRIAGVIQAHIDAGYRDAEEIRKRIDEEFVVKVMKSTGAVAISKSGQGFGSSNDLRVGIAQQAAFEAGRNSLRTGLKARILRDLAKPGIEPLALRAVRRLQDRRWTAVVLLIVAILVGLRGIVGLIRDAAALVEEVTDDGKETNR